MAEEQKRPLDANSRLKDRMRAVVPPRETLLVKKQGDNVGDVELIDISVESADQQEQPKQLETDESPQELVSFTLRVDKSIDKGLKSLCNDESITKETFLEAAFLICSENQELMEKVLNLAKVRRQSRRKVGVERRAKAMTKYLPSS